MTDSAFDTVSQDTAKDIRNRLLAGATMVEIRAEYTGLDGKSTIPLKLMRAMRDEVFEPLVSDPEAVKALANGSMLNPLDIIRYHRNPGRKPQMARPPKTLQMEMFPS